MTTCCEVLSKLKCHPSRRKNWKGALRRCKNEYYFSDLIGLEVVDLEDNVIGKVKSVDNFGAGNVMELEMRDGNFCSLPFSLDVVPVVDIAGGRVVVKPPTELDIEDAVDVMETG